MRLSFDDITVTTQRQSFFLVLVEIVLVKIFVIAVLLISSWSERVIPWLGGHSDKPKVEAPKTVPTTILIPMVSKKLPARASRGGKIRVATSNPLMNNPPGFDFKNFFQKKCD